MVAATKLSRAEKARLDALVVQLGVDAAEVLRRGLELMSALQVSREGSAPLDGESGSSR